MPYIIATSWYPSHKQDEVVKKYIELIPKYPTDDSIAINVATPVTTTEKGIKVMSIWEVKEGKLEAALTRLGKYYYESINIEGYEYSLDIWSTLPEATAVAGIPQQ